MTLPTQWHRKPVAKRCEICNARTHCPVDHRATRQNEGQPRKFLARVDGEERPHGPLWSRVAKSPADITAKHWTQEKLAGCGPATKLRDLFHRGYRPQKNLERHSANLMGYALRLFTKFLGRPATIENLTADNLRDFRQWCLGRGCKQHTAAAYRRAVNRLREWLIDCKLIELPTVTAKPVTFSTHKPYSVFEENIARIQARGSLPPECLVDAAIQYADERSLSDGQTRNMVKMARDFESFAGTIADFHKLTEELTNRWINELAKRDLKPGTVNRKRGDLLVLWRSLADRELAKYPKGRRVKRVKAPPHVPTAASKKQIMTMLDACPKLTGRFRPHGQQMGVVLTAWIHVAWDGALRPWADQLFLTWESIRSDNVVVVMQHKTHYPHVFRLRPETRAAIDAIRPKDAERIFPIGYKQMERAWLELCGASGVHIPPKMIRASRATDAEAEKPGSAPRVLGHKPGSTVAFRHYVDPVLAFANPSMPPELKGGAP